MIFRNLVYRRQDHKFKRMRTKKLGDAFTTCFHSGLTMSQSNSFESEYSAGRFPPVYLPPVRIILGASSPFAGTMEDDNMDAVESPPVSAQSQSGGGISLNVHLTVPQQGGDGGNGDGSHTPNTPEILNSIVSMQQQGGPFAAAYSSSTSGQGTGVGDAADMQGQARHQVCS